MPRGLPSTTAPTSCDLYEGITYQDYWTTKDTVNFDALEHAIVQELLPSRGKRLLDLGCGYGRLSDCYLERFESVVMFDGSRSLLKTAQQITNGRACYVWGDIDHLPFRAASFDSVLMVRVFQHLLNSQGCIQNASRILSQNGQFIFNYSNKRNAYRVLKYLLGKTRHNPFTIEPLMVEANFFHHHPRYIVDLLKTSGFEILRYRGAGVFNKIVEVSGSLADLVPSGVLFAPLLGNLLLAPWIFCQAHVKKEEPLQPFSGVVSLLMCPHCASDLVSTVKALKCTQCERNYPIEGGIVDMRVNREI